MSTTTQSPAGTVVSLWRYPVKSMMGEELNSTEVTERGVLGDRVYALIDSSTGKVVSAKNPKKWPNLLDFRAALVDPTRLGGNAPPVRVTLPDGTMAAADQKEIDRISRALGREVTLATAALDAPVLEEYWPDIDGLTHRETVTEEAMPPSTFFDCASVHLLTTATINRLRELYPNGRFEVRRFRPNIVVETRRTDNGFVENSWVGRTLSVGDEVLLEITGLCPRCVMTTLPQGDLPGDAGILRTAAQHNQASVGVYATVARGGVVRRRDPVNLR